MPETMPNGGPSDISADISALQNPKNLGAGIDEDTAIVVERGERFRALGSGAVYVLDGGAVSYSSLSEKNAEGVISIYDVQLHVLSKGDCFDLTDRRPGKNEVRRRMRKYLSRAESSDQATGSSKRAVRRDRSALIALAQGIFYLVTGIWPLVSIRSFEAVTGPKADRWLVKTAGVVITAIGAALTLAGWRRAVTPEMRLLAVGSALGLTGIDVVYVARGRISKVYLLDAAAELGLVTLWALVGRGLPSTNNPRINE